MQINRLIDTPYFSKEFCEAIDKKRAKMDYSSYRQVAYHRNTRKPEDLDYADLCIILSTLLREGVVLLDNNDSRYESAIQVVTKSEEFFSKVNGNLLELAMIRTVVSVFMDGHYPSKEYWENYKGIGFDEFLKLWMSIKPEDSPVYSQYMMTKCLDKLFDYAWNQQTVLDMNKFEDFLKTKKP